MLVFVYHTLTSHLMMGDRRLLTSGLQAAQQLGGPEAPLRRRIEVWKFARPVQRGRPPAVHPRETLMAGVLGGGLGRYSCRQCFSRSFVGEGPCHGRLARVLDVSDSMPDMLDARNPQPAIRRACAMASTAPPTFGSASTLRRSARWSRPPRIRWTQPMPPNSWPT